MGNGLSLCQNLFFAAMLFALLFELKLFERIQEKPLEIKARIAYKK